MEEKALPLTMQQPAHIKLLWWGSAGTETAVEADMFSRRLSREMEYVNE
jgi:hypothetical protein